MKEPSRALTSSESIVSENPVGRGVSRSSAVIGEGERGDTQASCKVKESQVGLIGHLNSVRWLVGWMQSSWCALVDEHIHTLVDIYWLVHGLQVGTLTSALAGAYWLDTN